MLNSASGKHKLKPQTFFVTGILVFSILSFLIYSEHMQAFASASANPQTIIATDYERGEAGNETENEILEETTFLYFNEFRTFVFPKSTGNEFNLGIRFLIPLVSYDIHLPPPKNS